jgi:hypothetical protein
MPAAPRYKREGVRPDKNGDKPNKTAIRPMLDNFSMPAKELLQSHFALASSKSYFSL